MVEHHFNSTDNYYDGEKTRSSNYAILYSVGTALVIAISSLLVVALQMKREWSRNEANLHRLEELERRKSSPQRRKRAISKLIETKIIMRRESEEGPISSHNDDNLMAIMSEDNNECPICLEVFEEGQDSSMSIKQTCHHIFHAECLELWLMKHNDCPCCRVIFIDESTLLEDEMVP